MSEDVMRQHIALYVNDYSVSLGADGRRAVEVLFERATAAHVIAAPAIGLFVPASS
jgi:1,4-dihydroxy-6-naphthoate synthase